MVEHTVFHNPEKYKSLTLFACSYLTFFSWNILTTWWLKNSTVGGSVMAIMANALLMTITFTLAHKVKKRIGEKWGSLLFICFWITFEFLHLDWDLTWTWLTLGNSFAITPSWIQWYEYTGVFGGSLWLLAANVLIFKFILGIINPEAAVEERSLGGKQKMRSLAIILSVIIIPIILSFLVSYFYTSPANAKSIRAVIVQPNIDPYNEKFVAGGYEEQLQKMIGLAKQKADTADDYLILPETALTEELWEGELMQSSSIKTLKQFLKSYPKLKIVIGASTAKVYKKNEPLSATARKFTTQDAFYDAYNTALQVDSSSRIQIYHKSKLVPGVERMPFPAVFKYLGKLAVDLGGTTGSLGTQTERSVFMSPDGKLKIAPVVCYESVYGEYVSEYVKNGAQLIAIITNDGWWGDTPGYKQHLRYGTLRAIETRRYIVRSANTGISCIINDRGEILQPTSWWTPDAVEGQVKLSSELTFYTRHGDYIARALMYLSLALIIYSWLIRFRIIKKLSN